MVTLKEIAERCNTSITTVSVVLNNKPNRISSELKEKIIRIANKYNYQPNSLAKSLQTGKTGLVGIIIPDLTNDYYAQLTVNISDILDRAGFKVLLGNTNDDCNKDILYACSFLSYNIDALIIITASSHDNVSEDRLQSILSSTSIPIVFLDRAPHTNEHISFTSDNYFGGYIATKHLISLGHTKIGFLSGPLDVSSAMERYRGYLNALNEANIEANKKWVFEGNYKTDSGKIAFHYFYNNKTTAIFSSNDTMASGLYQAAQKNSVKIPQDISIIGYDNSSLCTILNPNLTSIAQPTETMYKAAGSYIINMIIGQNLTSYTPQKAKNMYRPSLILRNSTCVPVTSSKLV